MNEPSPRFWPIFFELYESLPRQGPGNRDCAARALALCRDLPPAPAVLDLGCGVGGMSWRQSRESAFRSSATSHCRTRPGGKISIHRWRFASRNCAINMEPTTKRWPCWINSRRSPRCTAGTQGTMPMSSLWRVECSEGAQGAGRMFLRKQSSCTSYTFPLIR